MEHRPKNILAEKLGNKLEGQYNLQKQPIKERFDK